MSNEPLTQDEETQFASLDPEHWEPSVQDVQDYLTGNTTVTRWT